MHIQGFKLNYIIAIILSLFVYISNGYAADISAIDFNGNLIGKVIPDGSIIDYNNEIIGRINADGFALNDDDELIGGVVPQGVAISYSNNFLGKVNNDGTVTSINDNLVGKVVPSGLVVNDNYDILGAVVSPGLVYNDKGKIVGRVSGDGNFYDLSGEKKGYVTASGYVYAPIGSEQNIGIVGKLISSKMVVSSAGKFLGSMAPDGRVVDLQKQVIGNISANGFVYNADNKAIGHLVENGYAFNFDGSYIGFVSYNGDVINKGKAVATAVYKDRVIDKSGKLIGFTLSISATANAKDGKYLGRLNQEGNILRGRNIVGKIGASGNVIDNKGEVIGIINTTGPIFDYLGRVRANAEVGGRVVSLEGIELGYIQKDVAFDRKGQEIGRLLNGYANFDNKNTFLGMSGITSTLTTDGKNYKISPYGYIFDESEILIGRNYQLANIISSQGDILSYMSSAGNTEDETLNDVVKLTSSGILIDKNNKLIGRAFKAKYATDFLGKMIGYVNPFNMVVNAQNKIIAKILPDNNLLSLNNEKTDKLEKAGENTFSISINGDYLGINILDGQIKNSGEIVGKISSDAYSLDNMGALNGHTASFGAIVDTNCKFLGVVSDTGDARSVQGGYIGTVLANNQVINETEDVIGYIIQPQAVIGAQGKVLGIETPLGVVLNYQNQNLGCQDIYGNIRNSQNEVIGKTVIDASVMNNENVIIGYTDFSGKVIDSQNQEIGYIGIDGGVYDNNGINIGMLFQYKVAFDEDNTYLGRVNLKGEVISDAGNIIGWVDSTGAVQTSDNRTGYALNDLYVYDNEGKTIGYIAKNGRVYSIMGEPKGTLYQGFVLDKKQTVIARGARDFFIRDNNKVLGYLTLSGEVVDINNKELGKINENGEIIDSHGNKIAQANRLQYYHREKVIEEIDDTPVPEMPEPVIQEPEIPEPEDIEPEQPDVQPIEDKKEKTPEQKVNDTMIKHKVIGIAVTPGGKYIGDVYSNNEVIDGRGNLIGTRDDEGNIRNDKGDIIGEFQSRKNNQSKPANSNWWKEIMNGVTASPYNTNDEAVNVGPGGGIGPGGRYNPRRAAILAQLQNSRRQSLTGKSIKSTVDSSAYTGWQDDWGKDIKLNVSTLRVNMDNIITADKPIPAVLARSLVSLGEAPITAIVERNVYGDSGRNVIIPAGSRIIGGMDGGEIDSERFDGSSGGVKLEITWQRIIRPDGISFFLSSDSQTGDAQGRGGGALGYVDEQMVKKYAVPLFGTVATSAIAYMMAANEDATGEVENSKQQAASDAREQFLEKMNNILDEIIESKSEIQPVTFVPAGTRVIIYPMVDLKLRSTKEIEKGEESNAGKPMEDILAEDKTTVETQNNQQQQVNNNQRQVNNNNDSYQNASLVGDGNNQEQQRTGAIPGAIPPPAADGTVTSMPEDDEEDTGDIELF